MRNIFLIFLFIFFSCSNEKQENKKIPLTKNEKKTLEKFTHDLTRSISNLDYELLRSSWDNDLFKKRVNELTKSEKNVFNHYFQKDFSNYLLNINMELINKLKYNNGKIYLTQTKYFPEHLEIIYSLIFSKNIEFIKYRVQLKNGKPKLTDIFSYRDDTWQSQNIKNTIRLNSKYTAKSEERRIANRSLYEYETALRRKDSLLALEYLYEIPESHLMGNSLSLLKLNLAKNIHDSLFAMVLVAEEELNNSIYIKYLNGYYFNDTLILNEVFTELENKFGENGAVDSLQTLKYFWN